MLTFADLLTNCASVAALVAIALLCWLILLDSLQAAQDPAREERVIIVGGCLILVAVAAIALRGVLVFLHAWWAA
jgi:hypothetical protein